jgi:hypothetical protein
LVNVGVDVAVIEVAVALTVGVSEASALFPTRTLRITITTREKITIAEAIKIGTFVALQTRSTVYQNGFTTYFVQRFAKNIDTY